MAFYSHRGFQGEGFNNPDDEARFQSATGKGVGSGGMFWSSGVGPGEYYQKDNYTYKTVAGVDPNQPGWGNKVDPDWELVGYDSQGAGGSGGGFGILRRKSQAAAPAPAPAAKPQEPAYEPDKTKMAEAFNRAQLAKDQYAASVPTYNTQKDPYTAASEYGRQMQDSLLKYQDFADAKSGAQTTEISEAGKSALSRFEGAVADYKLPNWRDYLNA